MSTLVVLRCFCNRIVCNPIHSQKAKLWGRSKSPSLHRITENVWCGNPERLEIIQIFGSTFYGFRTTLNFQWALSYVKKARLQQLLYLFTRAGKQFYYQHMSNPSTFIRSNILENELVCWLCGFIEHSWHWQIEVVANKSLSTRKSTVSSKFPMCPFHSLPLNTFFL